MKKKPRGLATAFAVGLFFLSAAPVQAQQPLLDKINRIAFRQGELPSGWILLEDRVEDPVFFQEISTLISLVMTLPGAAAINLGHAIETPEGAFNVEYFAFPSFKGATKAGPQFKGAADGHGWLSLRLGDVILFVGSQDRPVQEFVVNAKLIPYLDRLLQEALAAQRAGELVEAEQGFYAVVKAAPVYAKAWLQLGVIYQQASPPKVGAAKNAYRKAVEAQKSTGSLTEKELWQALVGWGMTTLYEGDAAEAGRILGNARTLGASVGPVEEAKSYYFWASTFVPRNDFDQFLDKLEKAFQTQKRAGLGDLVEHAATNPNFAPFKDKKKFKKLLKRYRRK